MKASTKIKEEWQIKMDISKSDCIKVSIFFDGLVDVDTVEVTRVKLQTKLEE